MLKPGGNRDLAGEGVGEEQRNSSGGGRKVVRGFGHVQRTDRGHIGQRM